MWHMNRTGHQKLSDGSVLRLDVELGKHVASYYQPRGPEQQLILRAYSYGTFEAMKQLVADWADAFELSQTSPLSVGAEVGSGAAIPAPDQTNNLGIARETA